MSPSLSQPENRESTSDAHFLIPPLSQSNLILEKENKRRAHSVVEVAKRESVRQTYSAFANDNSTTPGLLPIKHDAAGSLMPESSNKITDAPFNGRRGVLAPLRLSDNSLLASSSTAADAKKGSHSFSILPASTRTSSSVLSTRRRVLRYRETMESLFCLTSKCTSEHWQLCRDIIDGTLVDDALTWSRVLKLATAQNGKNRSPTSTNTTQAGRDLVRLHRRATSRFPLDKRRGSDQSSVLEIWLSYAKTVAKFGTAEDSREIFMQIQDHGLGVRDASFYLSFAQHEEAFDVEKAKEVLQSGIMKNAQPLSQLTHALKRVRNNDIQKPGEDRKAGSSFSVHSKPVTQEIPTSLSPCKRKAEQKVSPKRRRTENGMVEVKSTSEKNEQKFQSYDIYETASEQNNMSCGGDEISLTLSVSSDAENKEDNGTSQAPAQSKRNHPMIQSCLKHPGRAVPVEKGESLQPSGEKSPKPRVEGDQILEAVEPTPQQKKCFAIPGIHENHAHENLLSLMGRESAEKTKNDLSTAKKDSGSALKRPPLLSKTPRLARVGLSGKPQRIGMEQSAIDSSESEVSDDECLFETKDIPKGIKDMADNNNNAKSVAKITKMDLDYMWAWNPDEHMRRSSASGSQHSGCTNNEAKTPAAPQNSEVPTSAHLTARNPQSSQRRKSVQSTDSEQSARSEITSGSQTNNEAGTKVEGSEQRASVSPRTAKLITNSNPDFLPLVNESNILRVNDTPYVKLGVVGKGGSSKVYRALTKECTVLAIKKVKLSGMDRKAIEGYANEIALLKRLRGNHAIIHMFDSEVDIKRKAIFVVMEAGEVDLNHVLQQQAMASAAASNGKTRALNINFIRLTWQQMLSAVNCIHEERIIHGDLKPANFLFVRGGLKLIDFGIAKAIQSDDTTNIYRESQIGTLNYMSPEAIKDTGTGQNGAQMKLGRPSDVWSLGCILYQMCYGKTPFASLHMIQKLQAIINPNHQISYPSTVDGSAIDAMQQCLRRKPEDRPPIVGKNGLLNEHCFLNSANR